MEKVRQYKDQKYGLKEIALTIFLTTIQASCASTKAKIDETLAAQGVKIAEAATPDQYTKQQSKKRNASFESQESVRIIESFYKLETSFKELIKDDHIDGPGVVVKMAFAIHDLRKIENDLTQGEKALLEKIEEKLMQYVSTHDGSRNYQEADAKEVRWLTVLHHIDENLKKVTSLKDPYLKEAKNLVSIFKKIAENGYFCKQFSMELFYREQSIAELEFALLKNIHYGKHGDHV